ncbi:hypothetical protein MIJ3_00382 [Pseudomonas phage vB_PaeM_MIJ3]|nr:hypothetical protein Paride_0429 [Pseudomonas phage Paride]VOH56035.1 hypothetical protein MIJ3_00382 [Pseudomonas phage vB_PaeM_MIJ3]
MLTISSVELAYVNTTCLFRASMLLREMPGSNIRVYLGKKVQTMVMLSRTLPVKIGYIP